MMMKTKESHAATFRERRAQRLFTNGERTVARLSRAAPLYSDSPDAKYKTTGFIVEIVSSFVPAELGQALESIKG